LEFTVDELAAAGSHIMVHKSKAGGGATFSATDRVPAAVVVTLPTGPEGHVVGTRLELIFGEALSDDLYVLLTLRATPLCPSSLIPASMLKS